MLILFGLLVLIWLVQKVEARYYCKNLCREEAQSLLRQGHYYLDGDNDGEACESSSSCWWYNQPQQTNFNNSNLLPVNTEPACSVKYPWTIKRWNKCVCPWDGSLSTYHPTSWCFKYNNLTTKKITSQKPKSTKKTATKKPVPKSNISVNKNNLNYCSRYPWTIKDWNRCLCPWDKNWVSSWEDKTYCKKIYIEPKVADSKNILANQPVESTQQNTKIEIWSTINGKREWKRIIEDQNWYKEEWYYSDNIKVWKWIYTNPNWTQREGSFKSDNKNTIPTTNTAMHASNTTVNKQPPEVVWNISNLWNKSYWNIIDNKKEWYWILTGSDWEIQQGNFINDKQEWAWMFTYPDWKIYKVKYTNWILTEKVLSK